MVRTKPDGHIEVVYQAASANRESDSTGDSGPDTQHHKRLEDMVPK